QAEDDIRAYEVTGLHTCALPIYAHPRLVLTARQRLQPDRARCRRFALVERFGPAGVAHFGRAYVTRSLAERQLGRLRRRGWRRIAEDRSVGRWSRVGCWMGV